MSATDAYKFYSYARAVQSGSNLKVVDNRKQLVVEVNVNGESREKTFSMLGRDDITGFAKEKILRFVPGENNSLCSPNNLAFVEFYEDDFPWRFSNEIMPNNDMIKPWLFLIVLKENEFILRSSSDDQGSLTYLTFLGDSTADSTADSIIESVKKLQGEMCYWAHVQSISAGDGNLIKDPDGSISRIICPRKLESNTSYSAFLLPTFEVDKKDHLVFHAWKFQTNDQPDFEYLASLLEPQDIPYQVGRRQINCENIGFDIKVPPLSHYLPMEGALTSVAKEPPVYHALQSAKSETLKMIAEQVNKTFNASDEDPVVSPYSYGGKHVQYTQKIDPNSTDRPWIHQLNTDPGYRAIAGLGAKVIRENQDNYMERAWAQLESLNLVHQSVHNVERSIVISERLFQKHIVSLAKSDDKKTFLRIVKPLSKKVMIDTKQGKITSESVIISNVSYRSELEMSSRRSLLNRSSKIKDLTGNVDITVDPRNPRFSETTRRPIYLSDGDTGIEITALPDQSQHCLIIGNYNNRVGPIKYNEKYVYSLTEPLSTTINLMNPEHSRLSWHIIPPANSRYCIEKFEFLSYSTAPIFVALIKPFTVTCKVVDKFTGNTIQQAVIVSFKLTYRKLPDGNDIVSETIAGRAIISRTDTVRIECHSVYPSNRGKLQIASDGYRTMTVVVEKDQAGILVIEMEPEGSEREDSIIAQLAPLLNPTVSHKSRLKRMYQGTRIEGWYDPLDTKPGALPVPIAYPTFDDPMYQKLRDLGSDYLIPNLDLMPNNCITLFKTNQSFVESFMAGLNVEMGRELRWREYPTDERGSYFRQFWDVKGLLDPSSSDEEVNGYKDIKPMNEWTQGNLGSQKPATPATEGIREPLVLGIRGGLLQAFPNSAIYAVKAKIAPNPKSGVKVSWGDISRDLALGSSTFVEPIFSAKIDPDITFKGFPLSINEVIGTGTEQDLGYFFIIKEIAGELRFGLDIGHNNEHVEKLTNWNDLSWNHLSLTNGFIFVNEVNINTDDISVPKLWAENSASMAWILAQKPVMIAIHAQEMLKGLN